MSAAVVETIPTPDGPFTVLEDGAGAVLASGWTGDLAVVLGRIPARERPEQVRTGRASARDAVAAFYDGDDSLALATPVRQHGTALLTAGWAGLRTIPAGQTRSYAEFAAELGRPLAVRAAASVCARNAAALFVPCHRVLRSDGTLGGFAWGLDVKRSLLEREASDGR